MKGPDDELRRQVTEEVEALLVRRVEVPGLVHLYEDDDLDRVLGIIEDKLREDLPEDLMPAEDFRAAEEVKHVEKPDEVTDALLGWAALVSYALARTHGPSSGWPAGPAAWGRKALRRIRQIVRLLLTPLRAVQAAAGATSCSISVSFPWGIAIGLSW